MRQSDLFETAAPLDAPSPERMRATARARLDAILREVRSAATIPWDERTLRVNRIVFPQMLRWLPVEEAAIRLAAFESELRRLGCD